MSTDQRPTAAGSPVRTTWLDADPPHTGWPRPQRLREESRLILIGVPVLCLVLLLVTVGLLGGFEERTDTNIDVAPGTLIETGPLQLTFERAEAFQQLDYDDQPESWVIVISGMVRTVDDQSTGLNDAFACADPGENSQNGEVSVRIQHVDKYINDDVQPGLPSVPFSIECVYPPEWQPGSEILVGARRQKMALLDPLGLGEEEGWQPRGGFFRVTLPYEITDPRPQ